MASPNCPCGSGKNTDDCCLPFIKGKKKPPTAEALMRARYTAFTRGDVSFIVETHHSRTSKDVKRDEIEDWSKNSEWLGLKITRTDLGTEKDTQGAVTFCATYKLKSEDKKTEHREQSFFEKEKGEWRFLDAQAAKTDPIIRAEPKTGRNDPCPCGSGKKNKKCCAT